MRSNIYRSEKKIYVKTAAKLKQFHTKNVHFINKPSRLESRPPKFSELINQFNFLMKHSQRQLNTKVNEDCILIKPYVLNFHHSFYYLVYHDDRKTKERSKNRWRHFAKMASISERAWQVHRTDFELVYDSSKLNLASANGCKERCYWRWNKT